MATPDVAKYQPMFTICAAVSFLCVLLGGGLIAPYNALKGRGDAKLPMCSLGSKPILQVELARSEDDLRAVLMTGDISRNVCDARIGNRLDTFLFIPAYAAFLLSVGLMLLSRIDPSWARILVLLAAAAVPAVALCDWIENLGIAQTLNHIEQDRGPHDGDACRISTPSLIKWTFLTLILFAYGAGALWKANAWRFSAGILLMGAGWWFAILLGRYAVERWGAHAP